MSCGRPSATPSSRTSSLNSSRSGSSSFRSERLRQAADVVVALDRVRLLGLGAGRLDDVGIDRSLRQPLRAAAACAASRWNTSTNSLPMILRLASGSATPASCRGTSLAGVDVRSPARADASANISITCVGLVRRSRPWSTKTQVSWSPIALWISAAATLESTPPERPRITSSSPTCVADARHRLARRSRPSSSRCRSRRCRARSARAARALPRCA